MKTRTLLYNARVYTQANDRALSSLAFNRSGIVAVGNRLEHDPDFASYNHVDLKGKTVIPGLVDAHTHFVFFARSLGLVGLQDQDTLEGCLKKIKKFAAGLKKNEWVVGEGYAPDRFKKRIEPDRYMLDNVTGGRPALLLSKDQHSAWVNSRALEIGGIDRRTRNPEGGEIVRFEDDTPTGILREKPGYDPVYGLIPRPSKAQLLRRYNEALQYAYERGVTGVHSFDSPETFGFLSELAERGKLGLRMDFYPQAEYLGELEKTKTTWGTGDAFLRLAGIKVFADGSLGSQTALCFNKFIGTEDKFGIEVTSVAEMKRIIKRAARLGFPCAIHAIGDKAVANVLDAMEASPRLPAGARHRIEHLQLIRRKDIARVKRLGVVPSMQPSHCPSDIGMARTYWGKRSANTFVFRTLLDKKIRLAFGSDAPIEPLHPIHGIAAAVRRARPGSRDVFHPEQRITAAEALYAYTVGPAVATGQEHCRGYLLPGYPADFAVLDRDITRVAAAKLYDTKVLATFVDGQMKYLHKSLNL